MDDTPVSELEPRMKAAYALLSVGLVIISGVMSGLVLGFMSLDPLDLEVLKRTGTTQERRWASRVEVVVKNPHFLLVTLVSPMTIMSWICTERLLWRIVWLLCYTGETVVPSRVPALKPD